MKKNETMEGPGRLANILKEYGIKEITPRCLRTNIAPNLGWWSPASWSN